MTATAATSSVLEELRAAYEAAADPERAVAMRRYLRDQFAFHGIGAPGRRALDRRVLAGRPPPDEPELVELVEACWRQPEREYQYFACDYFVRHLRRCTLASLPTSRHLITTRSWWDTVDVLATRVVGGLVRGEPAGLAEMDRWIDEDDIWLVRSALLHQLHFREATDQERLFAYCRRQAANPEFFVRKATGWALRQYGRTAPEAVRAFVAANDIGPEGERLSPLARREAVRNLPPVE